jgi:hypothetical protein
MTSFVPAVAFFNGYKVEIEPFDANNHDAPYGAASFKFGQNGKEQKMRFDAKHRKFTFRFGHNEKVKNSPEIYIIFNGEIRVVPNVLHERVAKKQRQQREHQEQEYQQQQYHRQQWQQGQQEEHQQQEHLTQLENQMRRRREQMEFAMRREQQQRRDEYRRRWLRENRQQQQENHVAASQHRKKIRQERPEELKTTSPWTTNEELWLEHGDGYDETPSIQESPKVSTSTQKALDFLNSLDTTYSPPPAPPSSPTTPDDNMPMPLTSSQISDLLAAIDNLRQ